MITILLIIALVGVIYFSVNCYTFNREKKVYEEIQEEMDSIRNEPISRRNSKILEFQQENPDIKGWIEIEETNINYPLLQTTDNEYYLNHNYKKEDSKSGSIFINSNCDIKNENSNIIIYGHYMKNGEMFNNLHKYQDKTFYEQHPIIKITTEEREMKYQVVCVFKAKVFYQNEKNVFRYYTYYDFENESQYNEYIDNCKAMQLYDTGNNASYGEQLVTLVTCEYSQSNGRIVVVAKRIN